MDSTSDFKVLKESLLAASNGPFFPDWEFPTLFGLERSEVLAIALAFSPATQIAGDTALALSNSINNLIGYPHGQDASWEQWISVTPEELRRVLLRWKNAGTKP